ncbi:PDR/VanB family oxidoreductase [Jatrophihabitans fulvus]
MSEHEPPFPLATEASEHRSELVVTAREQVASDVVAFTLGHSSGEALPAWTPGAHIDVLLDGDQLVRQYSLCGSPSDRTSWRIAVLHEPDGRGGSVRMHQVQVGDTVAVRGPRNHFELHDAPKHVFVAGGIGITPLLPMMATTSSDWQLWYGGRSLDSMAFRDEVAAHGDRVTLWPQDEKGLLPLAEILGGLGDDTLVYCCGPEPLLAAVEAQCPSGRLRLERFTAKEIEKPAGGDQPFEVVAEKSGITVTVPADKSILETLDENGVSVLSSCQEGVCGTCETAVLEGIPEHRDSLLTEDERAANDYMMICVGRSKSPRLVLDL